ncbi:MAG: hypothetical protein ACK564_00430 [Novosphingobium sp.]
MTTSAPLPPPIGLSIGVTGHRIGNAAFSANRERIERVLAEILDRVAAAAAPAAASIRLHCLLADGVDQIAARHALDHGWDLVAPLPFGRNLNIAIHAMPGTVADAQALASGQPAADPATEARAAAIRDLAGSARLFELAERDALLSRLFIAKLSAPTDIDTAQAFAARCSARVALAGRVLIEQSDLVIGVWDGVSRAFLGGTGHTISEALEHGAPVIWVNANNPEAWQILRAPEALAATTQPDHDRRDAALVELVTAALQPEGEDRTPGLAAERWRPHSNSIATAYRRIEALFSGEGRRLRSLRQDYETPEAIATGSGAGLLALARELPGADLQMPPAIEQQVLRRFAWTDGISAWLSDAYRGGMIVNFLFSALAVVVGILYEPLGLSDRKWLFAGTELLLLSSILLITWIGSRLRWHGRWFESRRVAEYLRHAPILLLLGVARAPGRWPKGADVAWPEFHARRALRAVGLPRVALSPAYLRHALSDLLDRHVISQRDYHWAKARRLTAVHHNLDSFSTRLFQFAVASVAIYLVVKAGSVLGLVPHGWPVALSKPGTFLGVALPTFGAAIAGIRYFGDFERFAAISEVTAAKLDGLHSRIVLLLTASDDHIDYARVSELAHAVDDVVVSEIENWQAVFGGKHIAVPV